MRFAFFFVLVAFSLLAHAEGQTHPKKSKTDPNVAAQKERDRAQELAWAEQENNRWIWKTEFDQNGLAYFLHNSERPEECNGKLLAILDRYQMREHVTVKQLCWEKRPQDSFVTISDPSARLFGSKKIDASKFTSIPSARENAMRQRAINEAAAAEFNARAFRQFAEDQRRAEIEQQNRAQNDGMFILRDSATGTTKTCMRMGLFVNCN